MKSNRDQLIEQGLQAQKSIFLALHAAADPQWLQLDLTMGQLKGLFCLAHEGTMTIGQLASALGLGKPAASILVDRLFDMKLVERFEDQIDRRRTFARLSAQGQELVMRLRQGGSERLRGWLGRLADDDLVALVKGLRSLSQIAADDQALLRDTRLGHGV